MNYFIKELKDAEGIQKTAGVKAREDADYIFQSCGLQELTVVSTVRESEDGKIFKRLLSHKVINTCWKKALCNLKKGDTIFVQFPCIENSILLANTFRELLKRGIEIVLLIHDLELLRLAKRTDVTLAKKLRLQIEENSMLRLATKVIVHNDYMKQTLVERGINEEKIISLEIFDYIIKDFSVERLRKNECKDEKSIIVAGNLRKDKATYVYHLPEQSHFKLYGVGYEADEKTNIDYMGAFSPDDLIYEMDGSFGLVWDGEKADTCTGVYGEYLKINNPHKTSLYLAAEIPVIIWKKAALADFVKKNNCGIVVDSLYDIKEVTSNMTPEEYDLVKMGARRIGEKLRSGYYLKSAIKQCLEK